MIHSFSTPAYHTQRPLLNLPPPPPQQKKQKKNPPMTIKDQGMRMEGFWNGLMGQVVLWEKNSVQWQLSSF